MADIKLKEALKKAKNLKGGKKRMFFVLAAKSPSEGKLIVSRRKLTPKQVTEAKEEAGTKVAVKGTCFGEEGKLVFEIAKPPKTTYQTLVSKIARKDAGFIVKPEFRQGQDVDAFEEVAIEDYEKIKGDERKELVEEWVDFVEESGVTQFGEQYVGKPAGERLELLMKAGFTHSAGGDRPKTESTIVQIEQLLRETEWKEGKQKEEEKQEKELKEWVQIETEDEQENARLDKEILSKEWLERRQRSDIPKFIEKTKDADLDDEKVKKAKEGQRTRLKVLLESGQKLADKGDRFETMNVIAQIDQMMVEAGINKPEVKVETPQKGPQYGKGTDPKERGQRVVDNCKKINQEVNEVIKRYNLISDLITGKRKTASQEETTSQLLQGRYFLTNAFAQMSKYPAELDTALRGLEKYAPGDDKTKQDVTSLRNDVLSLLQAMGKDFRRIEALLIGQKPEGLDIPHDPKRTFEALSKLARQGKVYTVQDINGRIQSQKEQRDAFAKEWKELNWEANEKAPDLQQDDIHDLGERLRVAGAQANVELKGLQTLLTDMEKNKPTLFGKDEYATAVRNVNAYKELLTKHGNELADLREKVLTAEKETSKVMNAIGEDMEDHLGDVEEFRKEIDNLPKNGKGLELVKVVELRDKLLKCIAFFNQASSVSPVNKTVDQEKVGKALEVLNPLVTKVGEVQQAVEERERKRDIQEMLEKPISYSIEHAYTEAKEHRATSKKECFESLDQDIRTALYCTEQLKKEIKEISPILDKVEKNAPELDMYLVYQTNLPIFLALCTEFRTKMEFGYKAALGGSSTTHDQKTEDMELSDIKKVIPKLGPELKNQKRSVKIKVGLNQLGSFENRLKLGITKVEKFLASPESLKQMSSKARSGKLLTPEQLDKKLQSLTQQRNVLTEMFKNVINSKEPVDLRTLRLTDLVKRLEEARNTTATELTNLRKLIDQVDKDRPGMFGSQSGFEEATKQVDALHEELKKHQQVLDAMNKQARPMQQKAALELEEIKHGVDEQKETAGEIINQIQQLAKEEWGDGHVPILGQLGLRITRCTGELNRLIRMVSPVAVYEEPASYHTVIDTLLDVMNKSWGSVSNVEKDMRDGCQKRLEQLEAEVGLYAKDVSKIKPTGDEVLNEVLNLRKAVENSMLKVHEFENLMKDYAGLEHTDYAERIQKALSSLVESKQQLFKYEMEIQRLALEKLEKSFSVLAEEAKKYDELVMSLNGKGEGVELEKLSQLHQRGVRCRLELEKLQELANNAEQKDIAGRIGVTIEQLAKSSQFLNTLERIVYVRDQKKIVEALEKLLQEIADLHLQVAKVSIMGRGEKFERVHELHERVSDCTGRLRHPQYQQLTDYETKRSEAKEILDQDFNHLSLTKHAIRMMEEQDQIRSLKEKELRLSVEEQKNRIQLLSDIVEKLKGGEDEKLYYKLRNELANIKDVLLKLHSSEFLKEEIVLQFEKLEFLDRSVEVYQQLELRMKEKGMGRQPPSTKTTATPEVTYSWDLNYGILLADVLLTNTSAVDLTNVVFNVTINAGSSSKNAILKAARIEKGKTFKWTNEFRLSKSSVTSKEAVLTCDQSR